MKKVLIVLMCPILLLACKTNQYKMGMTENEFLSRQKLLVSLVEKTASRKVYKRLVTDDGHGHQTFQYFYFTDGRLTSIDNGEYKPVLIMQHQPEGK